MAEVYQTRNANLLKFIGTALGINDSQQGPKTVQATEVMKVPAAVGTTCITDVCFSFSTHEQKMTPGPYVKKGLRVAHGAVLAIDPPGQ